MFVGDGAVSEGVVNYLGVGRRRFLLHTIDKVSVWKRTGFPSLCWQAWRCLSNMPPKKKKVKPVVVCGRCGRASHIRWVFNVFAFCRLVFKGMGISRPDAVIGKCRMIRHSRDRKNEPNPERCVSPCPTGGLGIPSALPAPTAWLSLCQA